MARASGSSRSTTASKQNSAAASPAPKNTSDNVDSPSTHSSEADDVPMNNLTLDSRQNDDSMDDASNEESGSSDEVMRDADGDAPPSKRRRRTEMLSQRRKEFGKRHSKLNEQKTQDSAKRFAYLIGLTDLFRHFIEFNPALKKAVEEAERINRAKSKAAGAGKGNRHRRTEKEEDEELLHDEEEEAEDTTIFTESPAFIHGEMRDYQVAGLNWLINLHENGISGILADEMGLGKTLQTISFLGYLRFVKDVKGPFLVVVPKSTLDNWNREFARWIPDINVLVLQGAKDERGELINDRLLTSKFDVCVTSYEMVMREKGHLKKFAWEYIIVDEAHRIKNEDSALSKIVRTFQSRGRLLITGTPLQNNLHELWALLNFLLPDVFGDVDAFNQWFETQGEDQDTVVKKLHKVLRPFLLRRVKADVEKNLLPKKEINMYIGMSDMQVKWYQKILEKDIDAVNGAGGKKESKTRLLNIVMQLRKCCNHPYLFEGAEPGPPYTTDEHLVYNSGKMVMLDKLLKRMKDKGSRVLIFSQMSRQLDILEDYCQFREYQYNRIDGSTAHEDRIAGIDEYNKEGSEKFVFLLTTRAGGLGINLTSADIVILYDSDWNPQADLQAMDRAHRIGQTKQVYVFRFVTENAIEDRILERAAQKLQLDKLVIQQGRAQATKQAADKDSLLTMIQHGAEAVLSSSADNKGTLKDDDIDTILRLGEEKTKELNARYSKLGLDDLQKFTSDSAYEWNGEDFAKREKPELGISWINPAKRERKEQFYSIDKYYRGVLNPTSTKEVKPKAPKPPKLVTTLDHQFYPLKLIQLQEQETAYFRKQINYKIPLGEGDEEDLDSREDDRQVEQMEIDNSTPLTEEEVEEKSKLAEEGFGDWSKREFLQFIQYSAKYGRKSHAAIAGELDNKTEKEVKEYAKVFWDRYTEIEGYERFIQQIETGEEKSRKLHEQQRLLRKKIEMYRVPLQQLKVNYSVSTTNKKVYTEEEDRFLLVLLDKFGLDSDNLYEKIQTEIRASPLFRFDWFFLARNPAELSRRCTTLLTTIDREFDPKQTTLNGLANGKKARDDDDDSEAPPAKKKKEINGAANGKGPKNKNLDHAKSAGGSKTTSNATSRAASVASTASSTGGGGGGGGGSKAKAKTSSGKKR